MNLTIDQIKAISEGVPIPLTVGQTPCVLLREDLYERLSALVENWDPRTMRQHMAVMMDEDWNDPAMHVYDQ